jgi:hypothetical protein
VSNKKRKPSSYRAPAAQPPPRRGLLDSILAPRTAGSSPMPRLRSTVARGATTALSITPLLVAIPLVLLVVWGLLIAVGFEGPFTTMSITFALPPVTSSIDPQIAGKAFRAGVDAAGFGGNAGAIGAIVGFLVFHAIVGAIVTTLSVEQLRTGSVSVWALRRAARVLPTTIAVGFMSLGLLIVGNLIAAFLGGLGLVFGLIGSMVVGIYLFGFAPTIAADEDRRLTDTLSRSVRAARLPGSANLWLAIIYVLVSLVSLLAPLPGSGIGVTPSLGAWAVVIVVSLGHVVMQSTLAYRYLAVEDEVPDRPPPRQAARR